MSGGMAPSAGNAGRFADLGKRIITAAIMAALAVSATVAGFPFVDVLVALIATIGLFEWARLCGAWREPGWMALGIAYLLAGAVAFLWLRHDAAFGLITVLWLLAVVAATDIAAYFGGRAIGGPKLVPWISPNKTFAGLISAIVAAAGTGAGFALYMGADPWVLAKWSGMLAIMAQAGDIFESGLKRYFGAKDSGALLPGHGGILDRIDGLLTATLVVASVRLIGEDGVPWR